MKGMRVWQCPKCLDKTQAKALEVMHRCPMNRNRVTNYLLLEEPKE